MIAPSTLPAHWLAWNARTGAPFHGPFTFYSGNCPTRVWEYAWAWHTADPRAGQTAIDVGGGLSGFGILLARHGLGVTVVDPDVAAHATSALLPAWSRAWTAHLDHSRDLSELPDDSVDVAFSLSVIEHIAQPRDRKQLMAEVHRVLRPGGRFVVTLDLDLHLHPFSAERHRAGHRNVSVAELLAAAPFELVEGDLTELYGLPAFAPSEIHRRAAAGAFAMAHGHLLTQAFVLRC